MPRDRRAVIGTGMWGEPSIRSLTRLQQQAYSLAYTQPDLNRCGVLAYRPRYWSNLAADGTEDDLRADFAALHDTRHVVLDEIDEQMLIRTYIRWDGLLTQPLVVAAMVRDYFNITSPVIRCAFLAEIRRLYDLPDLEPEKRRGVLLAIGTDPAELDVKNSGQVAKAIGTGLAGPLIEAIADGAVDPFPAKGLPKGLPEGIREGLTKGSPEGPGEGLPEGLPDPQVDPQVKVHARSPSPSPPPAPVSTSPPASTPAPACDPYPPPDDDPTGALLVEHARAYASPPPADALTPVKTAIARLVAEGVAPDRIRAGLHRMREKRLGPKLLPQLVAETSPTTGGNSRPSTTDQRVRDARNIAADLRAQGM